MKKIAITFTIILSIAAVMVVSVNHRAVPECLGGFVDSVIFDSPEQVLIYKEAVK